MLTHHVEHMQRATFGEKADGGAAVAAVVDANGAGERLALTVGGETVVLASWESVAALVTVAAAARDYMKSHADARKIKAAANKAK